MALWLKLTSNEGKPVRINMDMIVDYVEWFGERDEFKKAEGTFIAMNDSGIHVKESLVEIDDALIRPKNKLRLVEGGW